MTQKLVQSTIHSVLLPETKEIAPANSLIQTVSAVLVFSTVNENPQTNLSLNTSIKAQVPKKMTALFSAAQRTTFSSYPKEMLLTLLLLYQRGKSLSL